MTKALHAEIAGLTDHDLFIGARHIAGQEYQDAVRTSMGDAAPPAPPGIVPPIAQAAEDAGDRRFCRAWDIGNAKITKEKELTKNKSLGMAFVTFR